MSRATPKIRLPRSERERLAFVISYFDSLKNADILRKLHERRKACSAEWDALWDGMYALQGRAHLMAEYARDSGQLLFCFEGTTVLQGGAA